MDALIPDDIAAVIGNYKAGQRRIALLAHDGSLLVLDRSRPYFAADPTVVNDVRRVAPGRWGEWRDALRKARLL